jgi:putative Ca2+/H+ antiporter (TMEM165/GDT1 family)
MKKLLFLILAMSMPLFAQTVTFTTQGGSIYPEYFNVVTEGGAAASGTVEIAGDYGYQQSGIVLPNNPTAPSEYLNPIINILSTTYTGNFGDQSRTVTYVFNSTQNLYGYTWSGTFTATLTCSRSWRGKCSVYTPGAGSGNMTATPVNVS